MTKIKAERAANMTKARKYNEELWLFNITTDLKIREQIEENGQKTPLLYYTQHVEVIE